MSTDKKNAPIIRIVLTFFLTVMFCISCKSPPDGNKWNTIHNYAISFSIPSSLKKTDLTGIDSFVEEYASNDIKLNFDYGVYANNFYDWPKETTFENLKVDKKDAKIGTAKDFTGDGFAYSTQIHFELDHKPILSMYASCKSEEEVAVARKIFESIAFNKRQEP